MKNDAPKVVKIHDVKIDLEYMQWLGEIKARYHNAQIKAAVKVNAEQLLFNWQLGRDLVMRKAEEKWGSGIVEQVSLDLQAAFPEIFAHVPWGHNAEIIAKCKTLEEALFYVVHSASEGWSRNTLTNCIKADYFHTSGGAITNFSDKLPSPQSKLAQAITKDTYDFGFVSMKKGYEEEELKRHLPEETSLDGADETTTLTYGAIAARIVKDKGLKRMSAQAVGSAVGHNSISLIIPCHRVVGTNGSLTGYAGGIDKKVRLLQMEKALSDRLFVPKKGTALRQQP